MPSIAVPRPPSHDLHSSVSSSSTSTLQSHPHPTTAAAPPCVAAPEPAPGASSKTDAELERWASPETAAAIINSDWWNSNLPAAQHRSECPISLQSVSDRSKELIGLPNEKFTEMEWERCRQLVDHMRIDQFHRKPSEQRLYLQYCYYTTKKYGAVANYVLNHRLQWDTPEKLKAKGAGMFEHPDDWKILYNDWPYNVDSRVLHLVVWTKFSLPDDPQTGLLAESTKDQIEAFIQTTFQGHPRENIIWFKNWASLKSIPSVEHFHVMLLNPNPDLIARAVPLDTPPDHRRAALIEEIAQ